jgi:crotonobetainyl-CoA:carnitine CoA-transferase CaiB-like acyl-CoA transferase
VPKPKVRHRREFFDEPAPRFQEVGALVNPPDEDMGAIPMFGFANRMNETPAQFFRPAPKAGEHNDSLTDTLGK